MALRIHQLPALSDNYIYCLNCSESGETAVVDPGTAAPVLEFLQRENLTLSIILSTHHHVDHTGGNQELKEKTGCQIIGASHDSHRIPGIDKAVGEGDRVRVGQSEALVLETWGHTVGHISFYFAGEKALFCADTLFSIGCGRLFEGKVEQMYASLQKIASLPDDTTIYCAHEYTKGNIEFALSILDEPQLREYRQKIHELRMQNFPTVPTLLSLEKRLNPFLRCSDPKIKRALAMEQANGIEVFRELRTRKDRF